MSGALIQIGDCRETMRTWAAAGLKARTCVTSPPYFGLRDYGVDGQIGLEQSPEEYITNMVQVFRTVRDVLADDGTLWLNLGDSYGEGKQLRGIPWRVALALQADGWVLRQDIIWHKPNPMPEPVKDRCVKSHEYIFLLSKSGRYYFNHEAIQEPVTGNSSPGAKMPSTLSGGKGANGITQTGGKASSTLGLGWSKPTRNRRNVWTVTTRPYRGAHFATYPPQLIEPCILAGSQPGDFVLDPFMGSGTTAEVAIRHGRMAMGCELNPEYKKLIDERLSAL